MPKLALKVDVDTLRGTREGVPNLVELLRKHGVFATFLFSLGPDHTGRAIKRVFRRGFMDKVQRTSVVKHYGVRTLLYGTVLPGPDIGRRAGDVMRAVRDTGHETGIHCYDHVRWQDGVGAADAEWTERQMALACKRYTDIFKEPPHTHGAAGWQMNADALRLTQRLGFDYCSDGRGRYPHLPVWRAELVRCPQFPTTLPTLDELIGADGVTEDNVAARLLEATATPVETGHVFTLHAELEALIGGWKSQGWELGPLRAQYDSVEPMALPRCEVAPGTIAGRSGTVLTQGAEFLADAALAAAAD